MARPRPTTDLFLPAADWKGRGLAFLRFLGFGGVSCVFVFVPSFVVVWLLLSLSILDVESDLEIGLAIQVAAQVLGALAATALMARLTGRRLRDFGLGGGDRLRNCLIGVATGLVSLSLLLLVMHLASGFSLEPAMPAGRSPVVYGFFDMLLMLGIGFSEESLCRGYALVALSQSMSFWPAALAISVFFGFLHTFNDGETVSGVVSAALFGMVLAYSYRRTRSLWFAYGVHASWDYGESFIFGVPNSGMTLPGGLFQPRFEGPSWLTGGSAGPEGSILVLLALGVMLVVARNFLRPAGSAQVRPDPARALTASVGPS